MIVFIAALVYFLILFSVIEVISRKVSLPAEFSRKMAHIFAGVSAAFLPLVMPFAHIIGLASLFLVVMLISRKIKLFQSIHEIGRSSYGELFFPLAIALTALLFPRNNIYMYGILVMALGDGLAGLLGARFGKAKYRLGRAHKSYLGSGTFLIVSLLIGLLFSQQYGMVGIAILLTFVEAVSVKGLDNLLLPIIAALLLSLLG